MLREKNKKIIGIISVVLVIIFSLAVFIFIGKPLISFVSEPEKFRQWVDGFGIFCRFIFVAMIVLQVVVAIIPGEPFEIAAGYAFGAVEGTLLCILGAVIGSIIIFLLVRKFGVMLVEVFFSKDKIDSLKFLKNTRKLALLFFIVMLIPGTPKDLLSYFAPLTKMSLKTWVLIVSVSRIPSVITSAISGAALGSENYILAVISLAVTAVLSIIGIIVYNRISRSENK